MTFHTELFSLSSLPALCSWGDNNWGSDTFLRAGWVRVLSIHCTKACLGISDLDLLGAGEEMTQDSDLQGKVWPIQVFTSHFWCSIELYCQQWAGHNSDPEMGLGLRVKTQQQWNNDWCNKWLLPVLLGWWPEFRCNKTDLGDKEHETTSQKILLQVSQASLEFRTPGKLEGPELARMLL